MYVCSYWDLRLTSPQEVDKDYEGGPEKAKMLTAVIAKCSCQASSYMSSAGSFRGIGVEPRMISAKKAESSFLKCRAGMAIYHSDLP